MGIKERFELLFGDDPSLQQKDTGLRVSIDPVASETEDDTKSVSQDVTALTQQDENKDPKGTTEHRKAKDVEIEANHPRPIEEISPEPHTENLNLSGFFCPAISLSRFPYKFIRDDISQSAASEFFDEGKFWERSWDLYVFSPCYHADI